MSDDRTDDRSGARSGESADSGGRSRNSDRPRPEMREALDRLERAVESLASTARDEWSTRAAAFIEDTTAKLEREAGGRRERSRARRHRHRRERQSSDAELYFGSTRTTRLYRDRQRAKIAGVCAGLSAYLGIRTWVVRVLAVTGLIYLGPVVLPLYLVAMFMLPEMPRDDTAIAASVSGAASMSPDRSPPEERQSVQSPRRDFRDTQVLMSQAELRLRRMEAHVTSDQYELRKQLSRLEHGGATGGTTA